MRILVVDDDPASRLAIAAILRANGYDVTVAEDGEKAWNLLLERQINMVISDWNMPVMDGLELCRKIRSAELDWYVYIILCTARGTRGDLLEGLEAGADGFHSKPVDFDDMKVRIHI
jgi:sigma-B regulation protein RsbU (phosphoserine phosphatase)